MYIRRPTCTAENVNVTSEHTRGIDVNVCAKWLLVGGRGYLEISGNVCKTANMMHLPQMVWCSGGFANAGKNTVFLTQINPIKK